jgi:hypothetical protein
VAHLRAKPTTSRIPGAVLAKTVGTSRTRLSAIECGLTLPVKESDRIIEAIDEIDHAAIGKDPLETNHQAPAVQWITRGFCRLPVGGVWSWRRAVGTDAEAGGNGMKSNPRRGASGKSRNS